MCDKCKYEYNISRKPVALNFKGLQIKHASCFAGVSIYIYIYIHPVYPQKLTQLFQKRRFKHFFCTLYHSLIWRWPCSQTPYFLGGEGWVSPVKMATFHPSDSNQQLRSSTRKTQEWTTQEWTKPSAATLGVVSSSSLVDDPEKCMEKWQ